MSTFGLWSGVLPVLLLVASIVVVPGLVIGLALGLRREESFGAAPALSLGAIAIADVVSMVLRVPWGLGVVLAVSAVLAVLAWGVGFLVARTTSLQRPPEPRHGWAWSAGIVAVGCLVSAGAIARGIGSPESISQTFDSALHVNGIANVVSHRSAAPSVVGAAAMPTGHAPFYPPLFHSIAGLAGITLGTNPIVAANVVAVVLAGVMWPLSMMLLLRTVVGPSRFALAMGMVMVCVVSVFPAMLVSYGVLWPNALSYSIVPAALALGVLLVRRSSFPWIGVVQAGCALVVIVPGLYYSHPGAAFALAALGLPVLAAAEVGLVRSSWSNPGRRAVALGVVVVTVVGLCGVWLGLYHVPSLNAVRHFYWSPRQTQAQAVGEALFLTSTLSHGVVSVGVLVVVGCVWAVRHRCRVWLVASHLVVVALCVISTTTDGEFRSTVTGFWYNDGFRVAALLPVTGIPLAVLGALWARDALTARLGTWASRPARVPVLARPAVSARLTLASATTVAIVTVLLLPGTNPLSKVVSTVSYTYAGFPDPLVTPDEAALYRRISTWTQPGSEILANPWTGGVYAGVLSGREVVFPHMVTATDPTRALLMKSFDRFTTDPAVCRAVKSLRIGIVVDDSQKFDPVVSQARIAQYPGLDHLQRTRGLTLLGRSATASVYRVGDCSVG